MTEDFQQPDHVAIWFDDDNSQNKNGREPWKVAYQEDDLYCKFECETLSEAMHYGTKFIRDRGYKCIVFFSQGIETPELIHNDGEAVEMVLRYS
jgi:hypothetical protein